jgi:hypothetical protein
MFSQGVASSAIRYRSRERNMLVELSEAAIDETAEFDLNLNLYVVLLFSLLLHLLPNAMVDAMVDAMMLLASMR